MPCAIESFTDLRVKATSPISGLTALPPAFSNKSAAQSRKALLSVGALRVSMVYTGLPCNTLALRLNSRSSLLLPSILSSSVIFAVNNCHAR